MTAPTIFTQICLETGADGRAFFTEREIALTDGTPAARLSSVLPSNGYQLRHSPVGFRSQPHCTLEAQWVFILSGIMAIGLPSGEVRHFKAGEHFYSADLLPTATVFDARVHGHWSAAIADQDLVTLFVKK